MVDYQDSRAMSIQLGNGIKINEQEGLNVMEM